MNKRVPGFTLIEVLVSLSIVAIALLAGAKATSALNSNALRQTDALLAQLCAEQALARLRLQSGLPALGRSDQDCPQSQWTYINEVDVQTTPNPSFRRVRVRVLREGVAYADLQAVIGANP